MAQLPITNGFYVSASLPISHQECVNWYVNIVQTQGLSQETLFGTPGIVEIANTGLIQQVNRGAHVKNGIPYFVNGATLYSISREIVDGVDVFTVNSLGSIEGEGRVSMADNGIQLMILVPGGKGYIYNEDAGVPFVEITDLDFTANGAPQIVVFIDGYFAVTTDSKKWITSALNDGLSWNALDFGTAESDPDKIVAPVVNNNQIYITGSETTEGFSNPGNTGSGFAFIRNNVFLDKGCVAPFSIINANRAFFMLGAGVNESPAIWQFSGNNYTKISTTAIDNVLADYTDTQISESFAWAYSERGAFFVGFSFFDRSFVFDMATGKWHERKSRIDEEQTGYRVSSVVTAYGKTLVADTIDGRVGELCIDVYTEYGGLIIRTVSTQPFNDGGKAIRVPMIELTMESGVGDSSVPNPAVSMSTSKDGKKFGPDRTRSMGRVGEFGRRIVWRRNGRFPRFVVLRFTLSDPVKPVIIKLEAA